MHVNVMIQQIKIISCLLKMIIEKIIIKKKEAPQNLRNSVDDWDLPNNLSEITRTHSQVVQKKK